MIKPISVAIAEDHLLVRQGIVTMLNKEEGINVLFDVNNGKELLDYLKHNEPDVVLMDIRMPVMDGREALDKIKEKYPAIKVIIISMHYNDKSIADYILRGAAGILPKNCDIEKVVDAIFAVYEQGYYFDSKISKSLVKKLMKTGNINLYSNDIELTERELDILKLLCNEKNTQDIAEDLFISARTVEWHKKNIYDKTKSKNVVGLVMFAIKHKIIINPDEEFE